jgi:uncharacterized glyoxalase superfamily protein PhnB
VYAAPERSHSSKTAAPDAFYRPSKAIEEDHMNAIPFLRYEDPSTALEWLTKAFGFEHGEVHTNGDGNVVHAEIRFADGMVMLGPAGRNDLGMKTPREVGAVTAGVYLIVDDGIDAHYERAVAAGAEVVQPVDDTDYGSRNYTVRDPEGNLWSFGTYRPAGYSSDG